MYDLKYKKAFIHHFIFMLCLLVIVLTLF